MRAERGLCSAAVRPVLHLLLGLPLMLGGCVRSSSESVTLTVFAAASLAESFRAIERAYEAEHPGVNIEINVAGSQLLATQLLEGANAQVFASADKPQLDRVDVEFMLDSRREFASNRLVIVVPAGSAIEDLFDLTEPGVRVVLAGESVPAGRYARQALQRVPVDSVDLLGAVERNVVSNETDVREVVAKVRLGEADAGIVYATDVLGDAKLEARELPVGAEVRARYELAVIVENSRGPLRATAIEFVDFVTSPAGQAILVDHGFGPPLP